MPAQRELRVIPIHRSITRPQLIMGCERFLFLMLLMVVTLLIFGALARHSWLNFFFGVGFYIAGRQTLVYMAKKDAQMSDVYRRSVTYRHYYPSVSTAGWPVKITVRRW